jgi:phage shock protein C
MVGGVAGGIAGYLNVDTVWIRIAWLALLVLGPGLILYIIAWIVIPEADADDGTERQPREQGESGRLIIGSLLVLVGGSLLAREYLPWMQELILPAVLIAVGVGVIVYSLKQ